MLRRALVLLLLGLSSLAYAAGKPNIIVITLDSARADRMGFLGAKGSLTPNLDALAKQALIFESAYTQTPATVASHATVLTGTYPQTHRVGEFGNQLPSSLPFLPELLRAQGYRTAAFAGSIWLDPKNGFAPGFDRGFATYDVSFEAPGLAQRRGTDVAARAIGWLGQQTQGCFLWMNLADAGVTGPTYNAALTSTDAAIGKVLSALRARKLYDDALIVIVAPHGQSLGAHEEDTHGVFLYDETVHVPLLVKLPQNQTPGKRIRSKVRLVDIAPTILEVAGVAVPSQMQGQSLLRIAKAMSAPDQPAYSRSDLSDAAFGWSTVESWRAGKYLYIRAPKPELYDLSTDPGATRNLAQASKATLETMAAQLAAFDQRFTAQGSKSAQLSSSEMQKLASLGYVGLQKPASGAASAATGTDPKDVIAAANKTFSALSFLLQGKPDKSEAVLQPVMSTLSGSFLAQYIMGAALAQKQQYARATEFLHRAIELQPDSAWAHYQMGSALLRTADYRTAAVHLEIAATRLSNMASAHGLLADAYEHLGRAEEANRERVAATKLGMKHQ